MTKAAATNSLFNIQKGAFVGEINEKIQEATRAAMEVGRQSSITITIDIVPNQESSQVQVATDVKVRHPRVDKRKTFLFADTDGSLHRADPEAMADRGIRPVEKEA